MDYKQAALDSAQKHGGEITTALSVSLETKDDLSTAYTPGIAAVCEHIRDDADAVYTHTIKQHTVAVVSDGSAVLGLGNIGPRAALPVMEGKSALFKRFANIDAWPIVLDTQDTQEIIAAVKAIAPGFGGINLEDISAPRCFEIEEALQDIGIPVFHDDQHGTAIVVRAALVNAAKVAGKEFSALKVVINGAGAAGIAITELLDIPHTTMCDSKGIIGEYRSDLNDAKKRIAQKTNPEKREGTLEDALKGADVFIGVSVAGALKPQWVKEMASDAIIMAMANPVPEIMPDEALAAGALVVATGRSDFPNQVNNVLAFPGVFKGALAARAPRITHEMKIAAADALASLIPNPTPEKIIVGPFDADVAGVVAEAVKAVV